MEGNTDTIEQRSPNTDICSSKEFFPIKRDDLDHLKTRFNSITISGYDSTTNSDSNGCTFEENTEKRLKPATYIKFTGLRNRVGGILPGKLPDFADIQALDISECGLTEIPPVLLNMRQLKVLNVSDNHILSLPDDWDHLDLIALDISHNVLSEVNHSVKCQKNLEVLVLENCNLKDFPCHVLQLNKLRCLVLDNNPLGHLDFDAPQCKTLQSISLKSCLLPEFCGSWLPNTQELDLGNNSIQYFPTNLNRDLTVLKLYGNQLDTIPEELALLENLAELDVSFCQLKEFPLPILRLKKLEHLDISSNFIQIIPEEIIKLQLKTFYLGKNALKVFPSFLHQLIDLEKTDFSSCFLEKNSVEIYRLRNLRKIYLRDNCFTEFPENFCQLNLELFNVANNPLNELPVSFRNFVNLKDLDISSSNLKEIPSQILCINSLERLSAKNMALENLPENWKKCTNIRYLDLSENPLLGLPSSVSQLQKITEFKLKSCCLRQFPRVLLYLHSLQNLNLEDNFLAELPNDFRNLNMKNLNLRNNLLTHLPDSISTQNMLQNIDISSNKFTEFPSQILCINSLERLSAKNMALENLPENWKKCTNIRYLDLSENPLLGLPSSVSQLQKITEFKLKSCCLRQFPRVLLYLHSLQNLNLEDNFLAELPNDFRNLNMKNLNLRNNLLTHLPDSISTQNMLQNIDISSNKFTEFPSVIFELSNMKYVDLNDNFISVLPQKWDGLHVVKLSLDRNPIAKISNSPLYELECVVSLSLRNCLLNEIPTYFSSFSRMSSLDVSGNNISTNSVSTLPPNLTHLAIDQNPLGSVPQSVQSVTKLNSLSLNYCCLKDLPTFVSCLKRLETLSIHNNSLAHLPAGLDKTLLTTVDLSWNPLGCLDSLKGMKRLRELVASACQIHDFPREILKLKKLTELNLRWNTFRSIPGDIYHDNLRSLSLFSSSIKPLPSAMIDLKNLRTLSIGNIQEFPNVVLGMPQISSLEIQVDYDGLLMLPISWKDLGNLQNLECSSVLNLISICSLCRLENLNICMSKEVFPAEAILSKFLKKIDISPLFSSRDNTLPAIQSAILESLCIRSYKLPYLPDTLSDLSRLRELCISRSHLKDFPQGLCENLKKLEILDIGHNSLRILPKVWRCLRLRDLNLIQAPSDNWPLVFQQLPCLTRLNVSECRLSTFPPALLQLEKLKNLNISNNHITDLPPEWKNTCLKHLKIADNELGQGSSLSVIAKLSSLENLDISGNNLNEFPAFVQCLKFLRDLNVSNNPLGECPENVETFQALEIFQGSSCELTEFLRFLCNLQKIKTVELERNKIKIIPDDCSLPFLRTLRLGNNKGLNISPDSLLGVETFRWLSFESCGLTEIPMVILKISVLDTLNLEDNVITRIPEAAYSALKRISCVRINTNILMEPPKEIYEGSEESANQYYIDLKISEACNVGFHNVILLGSATAGKTSLIKSLINNEATLTKLADRTIAVDEEIWEVVENLHFHVIDFGGHEVYELVYPIFLKDRKASIIIAVDLSVISDSTLEVYLFPWLYTALSITGDSSNIVVVGTKADLCEDEETQLNYLRIAIHERVRQMLMHAKKLLDAGELQQDKINEIKQFKKMAVREIRALTTSSLSMSGFKELTNILLNHGRDNFARLPGSWNYLYKKLSGLKDQTHHEGFYRVSQLSRLCEEPMEKGTVQSCLTFMHQRGMVLWYGNHSYLNEYVFYDIGFIVTILKQLLRHNMANTFRTELHRPFFETMKEQQIAVETFRETGMATEKLLKCLWKNTADTEEIYGLAISVLKLFSICYEADSNVNAKSTIKDQPVVHAKQRLLLFPWFVRSAIDVSTLEELWPQHIPPHQMPLKCNFVFEYSIPKSLFEQFSVQLENLLDKCHHRKDWKDIIYLKQGAVQLLVRQTSDRINNTASMVVEMRSKLENASQMYKLFVSVAKTIQFLRKTFPGILYNEEYVCPHCILTDVEVEHTLQLNDALYEHPGETRQTDCKQDEIPAALHYPRLLGKSSDFIK